MQQQHRLKLIDGTFAPQEAGKILFELINRKINYHKMELFSNNERFSNDTANSAKRIEELKRTHNSLKEIIEYATEKKQQLQVGSFIEIKMV